MRWPRSFSNSLPIGIELSETRVRAIQFVRGGARPVVRAQASVGVKTAADGDAAYVSAIRQILETTPFRGRIAVASLPSSEVLVRPLLLPAGVTPEDGVKFQECWRAEARACLPYEAREAVIDYLPLGFGSHEHRGQFAVLLVAARRREVERYLEILKRAGLQCIHLELAASAATRMLHKQQSTYAFIDFEDDQTVVSIAHGPQLLFSRVLKKGLSNLVQAVAEALEMSPAESQQALSHYGLALADAPRWRAEDTLETGLVPEEGIPSALTEICYAHITYLVQEIDRTFRYFLLQPVGVPVELALAGGDWLPPRFMDLVGSRLRVELAPLSGVIGDVDHSFLKAAGLALWQRG